MKAGTEAAFEGEDGGERGKDINNIMNQTKTATKKRKSKEKENLPQRKKSVELQGIDPCASRMLSERSTI